MNSTIDFDIQNVLIFGAGNMGYAITEALLASEQFSTNQIFVVSTGDARRKVLAQDLGASTFASLDELLIDNRDILKTCAIILCVKPQIIKDVCADLVKHSIKDKLVISIAAGLKTSKINSYLKDSCHLVRVMPNIAILVQESMSVICASKTARQRDLDGTQALFSLMGQCLIVNEDQMDIACALSGSGPAYFEIFAKYMIEISKDYGLSEKQAKKLAMQTMFGTSKLIIDKDTDLQSEIDRVCSPGGTTLAALDSMQNQNLEKVIKDGIVAAYERSLELAELSS